MLIPKISICNLDVTRFIIGGNPFSGFSHQGTDRDIEMLHYFTTSQIKKTLTQAEKLGINTFIGRCDQHIIRLLMEYRDEGGSIQWFAQTCPEMKSIERSVEDAIHGGAVACFIHGGMMDFLLANKQLRDVPNAIEVIKKAGLSAGVAGHDPRVFKWAEEHLDLDFYMCSYYNASHRDEDAEMISGKLEWFNPVDRDIMVTLIQRLSKPAIHYKILAAGRNDPQEAFSFAVKYMRPKDAVCVGVYTKENPNMLEEDVYLFEKSLKSWVHD
jgi:hypothetical protein